MENEIDLGRGANCVGHQCKKVRLYPTGYGLLKNVKHENSMILFKIKIYLRYKPREKRRCTEKKEEGK